MKIPEGAAVAAQRGLGRPAQSGDLALSPLWGKAGLRGLVLNFAVGMLVVISPHPKHQRGEKRKSVIAGLPRNLGLVASKI